MKNIIITTLIAIASSTAMADGFSPWPNPTTDGSRSTVSVASTTSPSFYSAGLPLQDGRADAVQQAVTIQPYYLANR